MDNNQFLGFNILNELGSGAFSKTMLAEQNGKRAVIKVIEMPNASTIAERSAEYIRSEEFAEVMRSAGTQLNKLLKTQVSLPSTTGVQRYYDYTMSLDSENGIYTLAILMQYDTPLQTLLSAGEIPLGAILRMGSQLCEGLEVMQKKYVLHGNIKETNIFYNPKTGFALGDFFLNDILSSSLVPDRSFKSYGYRFLAPEAYEDGEYTQNTDIFSLGMMIYKIINRHRLPYDDGTNTPLRKVKARWDEEKTLPVPAIDIPELTKVLAKATAYRPEERFSSYLQFKAALDRLLSTLPREVLHTALPPYRPDEMAKTEPDSPELKPPQKAEPQAPRRAEARDREHNLQGANPLMPAGEDTGGEDKQPRIDRPVRPLRHADRAEIVINLGVETTPPLAPAPSETPPRKLRSRIPNESFNYFDYNSEEFSEPNPRKRSRRLFFITAMVLVLCVLAVAAGFLVKYMGAGGS